MPTRPEECRGHRNMFRLLCETICLFTTLIVLSGGTREFGARESPYGNLM
jgi:hypothetical protein